MIRAKIWFRCAAMHDPVTPMIVKPALIGWEAKQREVTTVIERAFKGDELIMRMKGWVTVDVKKAAQTLKKYGYLKVLDDQELVIDVETETEFQTLEKDLREQFDDQLSVEKI